MGQTMQLGRPQADRSPVADWLKNRLSQGPVPGEVLREEVEQKQAEGNAVFNKKALDAARLALPEVLITRKHNVCWWMDSTIGIPIPSGSAARIAQETNRIIRDDREYQHKLRDKEILTESDLIQEAILNHCKRLSPSESLDVLMMFYEGNDWDKEIPYERVIQINANHGPKPPKPLTPEETLLNHEFDYLVEKNKAIEEIHKYLVEFRALRKRPPTEKDKQEYRKLAEQDINIRIQELETKITSVSNATKRLSEDEIHQHPEVIAYRQQNDRALAVLTQKLEQDGMLSVRNDAKFKRLNKDLIKLEERLREEVQALTPEEVASASKSYQDDIDALRTRLSNLDSEAVRSRTFFTDAEVAHVERVRNLISEKMVAALAY